MSSTRDTAVNKILKKAAITASAPCRIDSGGTWDIKAIALPFEQFCPVTVNIALNLRTTVCLKPYRAGHVRITSEGFPAGISSRFKNLPMNGPFGIFFGAVRFFGFHGLSINIKSESPLKSALGGSSTALVALIKALSKLKGDTGGKEYSNKDILHLGYNIEDGISGGNCGIQDQASAVYGGVNRYTWHYSKRSTPVKRELLLDKRGTKEISERIMVAFSGKSHVSARTNRIWISDFLNGRTRSGWLEANSIVNELSMSIKAKNWEDSTRLIREEMRVRRKITPDALIPVTQKLITTAERLKCGARFTGAGAGGSVWALGEPDRLIRLKAKWDEVLNRIKGATILECTVDSSGVK